MRQLRKQPGMVLIMLTAYCLLTAPLYGEFGLSSAEEAWLARKKEIVFAGQQQSPPFEFVNENGDYTGMTVDLIRWLS